MAVLESDGVSKAIGGVQILKDITLVVNEGERRAIIGPNGAGKTTLFRTIAGELYPNRGRIRLFGDDVTRLPMHIRARKGMLRTFQKSALFFELSVRENLLLSRLQGRHPGLGILRLMERDRATLREVDGILEAWDLREAVDLEVKYLPYGLQRRVELAVTFLRRPRLLLLDEPTAGLAASDIEDVAERIRQLPKDITVVLIEHNLGVVFSIADRISVLHHGQLLAEGSGDEIRANPVIQSAYLGSVRRRNVKAL